MANGLYCQETMPGTPKYGGGGHHHQANRENTAPDSSHTLLCTEVLEDEVGKLESVPQPLHNFQNFHHPPVKADCDTILLKDDRVLQNLLKNEERYLPRPLDYLQCVQVEVKPHMRKIVADWMLQVCQESCCQPEVFCLAMNLLDRFLAICRISKNQLQLLGATCLFLSSKFKTNDHISSETLVMNTDYSINHQDLKYWELLVLQKLRWELSSTTPLDYLDHILPRLSVPAHIDIHRLRMKTETIIALAATHLEFCSRNPSLVAAASIMTALNSCNMEIKDRKLESLLRVTKTPTAGRQPSSKLVVSDKVLHDTRICLQVFTHVGTEELAACCSDLGNTLPSYLTGHLMSSVHQHHDADYSRVDSTTISADERSTCSASPSPSLSPVSTVDSSSCSSTRETLGPLSALEIFTDLNNPVISSSKDNFSANSILVT